MPRPGAFHRKSKKETPVDSEEESLSRTVADFGDWVKGEMQKDRESQAEGISGFHHLQSPFAIFSNCEKLDTGDPSVHKDAINLPEDQELPENYTSLASELRDTSNFPGDEQAQRYRGSHTKGLNCLLPSHSKYFIF